MTESEPDSRGLDAQAANDLLAARLLAARRALNARDIDPDVRARLQLRFRAICTSLKMPAANRVRLPQRLDRLIADAQTARRGTCAASARPVAPADAMPPDPGPADPEPADRGPAAPVPDVLAHADEQAGR